MSPIVDRRTRLAVLGLAGLAVLLLVAGLYRARTESLPDFAAAPTVAARKDRFFDFLRPKIRDANADIRADRERLVELAEQLDAGEELSWFESRWLRGLAADYDLDPADFATQGDLVDRLLTRVDIVPAPLALVQAAKESGWGTARFAVEGNNLFGQQCFVKGCGFVPERRAPGRSHEVARFRTADASVDAYLHNLNTHPRYASLRRIRRQLRAADEPLRGTRLADGLTGYSERGEAYVQEVKSMIRQNDLE